MEVVRYDGQLGSWHDETWHPVEETLWDEPVVSTAAKRQAVEAMRFALTAMNSELMSVLTKKKLADAIEALGGTGE